MLLPESRGGNGSRSDPDLTVFSRILVGFDSSFIRRCGSGSDPELILLITFKNIVSKKCDI